MSIESNKEAYLIGLYYSNLGDGYFLEALKNYSNGGGFGLGDIWCVFAEELQPWEEGYFGKVGVAYFFDHPSVEKDEVIVVDYNVFYRYLKEASDKFIERNLSSETEVNKYMSEIKNKFKVVNN